jgi:ubiquinone/menaquinone biosynthesis C-methylase UbiE
MSRMDYDGRIATVYDRGRAVPLDGLTAWRTALAHYLPPESGLPVLDVGAGTGLFAVALAEWFGVDVIAVEAAAAMRCEALRKRQHPRVTYLAGHAAAIPVGDGQCGSAWLSTVIHHIPDLRACARELHRVLHPGERVLIRSAFPGRLDGITLFRFFPEARQIAESFPTIAATVEAFAAVGFAPEALESVSQVTADSLWTWCERVRLRADSTLQPLPDAVFARRLAEAERAAAEERVARPVVDRLDLLVLRLGQRL